MAAKPMPAALLAEFTITAANGPSLTYASSDAQCITLVDHMAVEDPRERAICRALLVHALALLDAEPVTL